MYSFRHCLDAVLGNARYAMSIRRPQGRGREYGAHRAPQVRAVRSERAGRRGAARAKSFQLRVIAVYVRGRPEFGGT